MKEWIAKFFKKRPTERKADFWCTICDGRIWPWERGVRIYSLGMTRAHIKCASDFLASELSARGISNTKETKHLIRKIAFGMFLFAVLGCGSKSQTNPGTYNSTFVRVNIGAAEKAEFCFGPVSSPCIGHTVAWFNYPDDKWQVIFNYAAAGQVGCIANETYTLTPLTDPDHDSNRLNSVVINTADDCAIGARTIKFVSASFQSEQVGMHDQNETLGGSATITIQ